MSQGLLEARDDLVWRIVTLTCGSREAHFFTFLLLVNPQKQQLENKHGRGEQGMVDAGYRNNGGSGVVGSPMHVHCLVRIAMLNRV